MKLTFLNLFFVISLVASGCVLAAIFSGVGSESTEIQPADFSPDGGSDLDTIEKIAVGSPSAVHDRGQMELNEVVVYNGIISEISVSPTLVTYDYNHDGIVEIRKTVLFFNIG